MSRLRIPLAIGLVFCLSASSTWSRSDMHKRVKRAVANQRDHHAAAAAPRSQPRSVRAAITRSQSSSSPRSRFNEPRSARTPPASAPRPKKPGFFARLFGRKKKPAAQPAPAVARGPVIPRTIYHQHVLKAGNRSNTSVVIDVSKQKGYLLVGGQIALEAPVSTARSGKHTPRGTFRMGERVRSGKVSTIYGVGMPYWMRLGSSLYGVHAGYLPGYPASAGCIRLPGDAAKTIFDNTRSGTQVRIYSSWRGG